MMRIDPSIEVIDPCTNSGYSYNATVGQYTYTFVGDYDQSACDTAIQKLFDKNIECSYSHCSFLGVYQPLVDGSNFVALDDMALVVLFMNVSENPKIQDIYIAATQYCSTSFTELMVEYPEVSSSDLGKYCFEANYIYQMLAYGFVIHLLIYLVIDFIDWFC
jgi:Golgi nucleoside diphosphatase